MTTTISDFYTLLPSLSALQPLLDMSAQTPDILTSREAAELLRLSEPMLRKLRRQGKLPFLKFGRAVRFRREDLELFTERHVLNRESGMAALVEEVVQRLEIRER